MLKYLWSNKEWIFSGIGVLLVASLGALVSRLVWGRRSTESGKGTAMLVPANQTKQQFDLASEDSAASSAPARVVRIATVDFASITRDVKAALPLQRDEVSKRYVGLNVQWNTLLYAGSKREDGTIRLSLDFGPKEPGLIHCEVRLEDYRELNILPKGHPITVIGEIEAVTDSSVSLGKVQLLY